MKFSALYCSIVGVALFSMSSSIQADVHNGSPQGLKTAIEEHDKNIDKYSNNNPDKALPSGLIYSNEVLMRLNAGLRPQRPQISNRPIRAGRPQR